MRLTTCLFAVASLAATLPAGASANELPPPPPRVTDPVPPPPPPPPSRGYQGPYTRVPPHAPHYVPRPYYPRPRYWGWGWGWYPLYPLYPVRPPPPPPSAQPYPPSEAVAPRAEPPDQDRLYTRFSVYGAARTDGYMAGLTFGLDSRYVGFDADVSALARESVTGPLHDDGSDPATLASAHVTWSFLSDRSFRLRLETGMSMLDLPNSPAVIGQPWRGRTLFGPDVGVSAQLGMVGPVGLEGYARVTPLPQRIVDTFAGVTVHGGPVGISAGWRWVDIAGDGIDAPKTMFRGPQVGMVLAF